MQKTIEELLVQRVLSYRRDQDIKHTERVVELNDKYNSAFFAPCSVYDTETSRYYFRINILDGGGSTDHTEFSGFGRTLDEAFKNTVTRIDEYFVRKSAESFEQEEIQRHIDNLFK